MNNVLDGKHTAMMLSVVFLATFMDGVDGSIVNVALPTIGDWFGVDTATVSWVAITYMMVLAGLIVAFARIAADTGVRKVLFYGLVVFTAGSLLCGLSVSFPMLIASRAVQAVGASMMAAAGPMCCTEHLPADKLGFGMGVVTIGASVGFALGPAIGGAMLEVLDWPWIFLINIPIGAVAAPLILKAIPADSEKGGKTHMDYQGTVLLFAAIALGTFAIETLSYASMRVVAIVAAVLCLGFMAMFVHRERNTDHPLIRLSMFRRLDFSAIFVCLMLMNMTFMGMLYLIPFFGEICMGLGSLEVGAVLFISAMVTAFVSLPISKWSDRVGRKWFCVCAGLFSSAAFLVQGLLSVDLTVPIICVTMVVMGFGWAFAGGPMASRLVEHAGEEKDMAASLMNEAYYVGGAIGTALVAMLFTAFSGSDGIDIREVSVAMFDAGFAPTAVIVAAMAFLVAVMSFVVKDGKN
ncbi:MAG: MFS transporter [archaeon]|nr:MFS transporter [archaeon]